MSTADDREEEIELGVEVSASRGRGSALIGVRVPTGLLRQIQGYAQARGLTVSAVLRLGAEKLVEDARATGFAMTYEATTWIGGLSNWARSRSEDERMVVR